MNWKRFDVVVTTALLFLAACGGISDARIRGGGVASVGTNTCPNGLTYVSFDECDEANPNAQFVNANLLSLALDSTGNAQTIHHPPPFNPAGIAFPVGQTTTTGKGDPRDFTLVGSATITGTNTLNISSITNGGVPQADMWAWDRPGSGTQHYTPGLAPKIVSCTAGTGGFLYQCLLDRTVTNRSSFNLYASMWYGCVTLTSSGTGFGGSGEVFDEIYCDFRGSAGTATAEISNISFGPIGGHNATLLSATTHNSGSTYGTVSIDNSYLTVDQYTEGNGVLSTALSAANARLILSNSECDGGNASAPILGPYPFPDESTCLNWDSPGSTGIGRNQVTLKGLYIHDWTGRPISTQAGDTDVIFQSSYAARINMDCNRGLTCHGTLIAHGTTIRGSSGSIKVQNITGYYPYGQAYGAITGMISLQGGISSAATMDVEIAGLTVISNTGSSLGHAILEFPARIGRAGYISSVKLQHFYVNSPGITYCFGTGGDLQSDATTIGAMVANSAGDRSSTVTWSGFNNTGTGSTLYYQGAYIGNLAPSSQTTFLGTLTDNLNGTSTLTISGTPPATIAAGLQVAALRMADTTTYPTLIVSGSGSSYIVDNGSGSGENRAAQSFAVVQVIKPFGTTDPATGLPSTASASSSATTWNGTTVVGGLRTITPPNPGSPANQNWSTFAPGIGNVATIDADIHDYYMMNISGSGGEVILDGVSLDGRVCPGTQPP